MKPVCESIIAKGTHTSFGMSTESLQTNERQVKAKRQRGRERRKIGGGGEGSERHSFKEGRQFCSILKQVVHIEQLGFKGLNNGLQHVDCSAVPTLSSCTIVAMKRGVVCSARKLFPRSVTSK
jgi:hypothetical protein